jgi:flagellar hook-basal body complex protein FliE
MSQGISAIPSGLVRGAEQAFRLDDMPYEAAPRPEGKPFGEFLTEAIGDVNRLQQVAGDKVQAFATGGNLDVHEVMIAMEQASTALALTTQVRNKLVDAYQELMHMQV